MSDNGTDTTEILNALLLETRVDLELAARVGRALLHQNQQLRSLLRQQLARRRIDRICHSLELQLRFPSRFLELGLPIGPISDERSSDREATRVQNFKAGNQVLHDMVDNSDIHHREVKIERLSTAWKNQQSLGFISVVTPKSINGALFRIDLLKLSRCYRSIP